MTRAEPFRAALAEERGEGERRWTEGICGDGAAILFDGVMVPVHEVVRALNCHRSQPPAEGEVAELVARLRTYANVEQAEGRPAIGRSLSRAAELLQQQHPTPVPVSEGLPGPEDCDAEGRCWLFSKVEKEWRLIDAGNPGVPHLKYCFSHWLPAHALPLPQGEVE